MLPLEDPRWKRYEGGYRLPYDASVPIRKLLTGGAAPELWEELWSELHHQGDVGPASYAAVPYLVEFVRRDARLDSNALGIIATIELQRPANPAVPDELEQDYFRALAHLPRIIGSHPCRNWDELQTASATACLALARGQRLLARAYLELSANEAREWLTQKQGYGPNELF